MTTTGRSTNSSPTTTTYKLLTLTLPKKLQRKVRNTLNKCQQLIKKTDKWKYVNLNPKVPTIRGLIKVHNEGAPIRPIINWKNTPAYKPAKMLTKKLHTHIPLPYAFNVENTV
jgi:hypothetical protein